MSVIRRKRQILRGTVGSIVTSSSPLKPQYADDNIWGHRYTDSDASIILPSNLKPHRDERQSHNIYHWPLKDVFLNLGIIRAVKKVLKEMSDKPSGLTLTTREARIPGYHLSTPVQPSMRASVEIGFVSKILTLGVRVLSFECANSCAQRTKQE